MTEDTQNNNSSAREKLLFRLPKQPPHLEFDEFTIYFIYGYCLDPKRIIPSSEKLRRGNAKKLFKDQHGYCSEIETWIPPYNLRSSSYNFKRFQINNKPLIIDLLYTRYDEPKKDDDSKKKDLFNNHIKEIAYYYARESRGKIKETDIRKKIEEKIKYHLEYAASSQAKKDKKNKKDEKRKVIDYIGSLEPVKIALYKDVEIRIYITGTDFGPGTVTFEVKLKPPDDFKYDVEDVLRILKLVPRVSGKTAFHTRTNILCMDLEKLPGQYRKIFEHLSASSSNIREENNRVEQEGIEDTPSSSQHGIAYSLLGRKLREDSPILKKELKKRKWDSDSSSLFKPHNMNRFSDLFKLHLEILNTVFSSEDWTEPDMDDKGGFYGENDWLTDPQTPYIYLTTKVPEKDYRTIFKDGNLSINYKHIVKEIGGMLKKWLLYENIIYVNPKYFENTHLLDSHIIVSGHHESNLFAMFSNNLALTISPNLKRTPDPLDINIHSLLAFLEYSRLRFHHLLRINKTLDQFLLKISIRTFDDCTKAERYSSYDFLSDLKELLPLRYRIIRILNDMHKDIWNYEVGSDLPMAIQNKIISSIEETIANKLITIDKFIDDWNFIRKSEDLNKYYKK